MLGPFLDSSTTKNHVGLRKPRTKQTEDKGTMKKLLQMAVALCVMLFVGLTTLKANTVLIPVFVTGTAPESGVVTVLVDDATSKYLSIDISHFPEKTFVMKLLTDTAGGISISQIDPTITKPVISYGAVNAPEHNTYNTEIQFQLNNKPSSNGSGRYYGGVVVFYNPNGWTFSTKTYKMMFHIGGTGTDGTSSCWLGETVPPTACTVTAFNALEVTNTVMVPTQQRTYSTLLKKWVTKTVNVPTTIRQTTIIVGLGNVHDTLGFDVEEQQVDGTYITLFPLGPTSVNMSYIFDSTLSNRTGRYRLIDHDTMVGDTVAATSWSIPDPLPVIEPTAPNTN